MERLREYHWPGNVRELRNVIERGCLLAGSGPITDEHLLLAPRTHHVPAKPAVSTALTPPVPGQEEADAAAAAGEMPLAAVPSQLGTGRVLSLTDAEKSAIGHAMAEAKNNKNEAARLLGIHRTTLYKKLAEDRKSVV